jgi:hypothetical protein
VQVGGELPPGHGQRAVVGAVFVESLGGGVQPPAPNPHVDRPPAKPGRVEPRPRDDPVLPVCGRSDLVREQPSGRAVDPRHDDRPSISRSP